MQGGWTFKKLTETPLIYCVSYFNLGRLGALIGGRKAYQSPPWRRDCAWCYHGLL